MPDRRGWERWANGSYLLGALMVLALVVAVAPALANSHAKPTGRGHARTTDVTVATHAEDGSSAAAGGGVAVTVAPTTTVTTTTPPTTTAPPTTTTAAPPPPPAPPPAAPSGYGCAAALAYLQAHAAPGFSFECPGYAQGHQAMTCDNVAGVCPGAKLIAISVPCAAAYMNEASNSWVVTGQSDAPIDPYGYCD